MNGSVRFPVNLAWPLAIAVLTWLIACAPLLAQAPVASPARDVGIDQHLGTTVPLDAVFRDEAGRSVRLGSYFGKRPVVLAMVYYRCPMLCTQVLNGLLQSAQSVKLSLGEDYDIVTVSFDPRETPALAAAKKARYVRSYRREGAERGWHFLTGDKTSVERLARAVGFRYRYDAGADQFAHASGIILLTPEGQIGRYFYGIDYRPQDLRLGLVECSQGKIGSKVDQLLLLCYHYDPQAGRYNLAVDRALRAAGGLTVLLLGGFLALMYGQERRRSRTAREAALSSALERERSR